MMIVAARLLFAAGVAYLAGDATYHVVRHHIRNCAACRARQN